MEEESKMPENPESLEKESKPGKKSKKPVLTPEERKIIKMEKIAARKLEQELKKLQDKRDYLTREVKYSDVTLEKAEKSWREMLLNITVPRMLEDLEYAWHNFEKTIDSKNFILSILMVDLEGAEEQYMINLKSHIENLDKLINMFNDRLDALKNYYDGQQANLHTYGENEATQMNMAHAEEEKYLKVMLYSTEVKSKKLQQVIRGAYLSKKDELVAKDAEEKLRLISYAEQCYMDLWSETKNYIKEYANELGKIKKNYTTLWDQDQELRVLIKNQKETIKYSHDLIHRLNSKLTEIQDADNLKIAHIMQERDYFSDAFWTFRKRLAAENKLDENKLTTMTMETNRTMEYLIKLKKKGEKILQLASICRKYETEKEKITSFPTLEINGINNYKVNVKRTKIMCRELGHFWQRVAQADALRYSIYEEREMLKRENEILKAKIYKYSEKVNCPTLSSEPTAGPKARVTVIDGNCAMKHYDRFFG